MSSECFFGGGIELRGFSFCGVEVEVNWCDWLARSSRELRHRGADLVE